jgi:signal transduction histidine kinase
MSRTPSSKPPPRSSAAKVDGAAIDDAMLAEAGRFLAERRSFGLVWADEALVVRRKFGALLDFVALDCPLSASVMALVGLEDDIAALRQAGGGSISIPNVIMSPETGEAPRLSIDIHWVDVQRTYLVHVRHAIDHSALESELSTQMRRRAIAEAEVLEKTAEIQRTNQELARANRDLEEFAYVISHDLKAPLRALRYDSNDADRNLAAGDVEGVKARLAAVRGHETRMRAMLDGLFAYARIGLKDEALEAVDTRVLVNALVAGIGPPDGMTIDVGGDWPQLTTLVAPLDLVLRNLVDNAIKHHDRTIGRITLNARDNGEALTITVTDDGPGIPREWHAAVFLPFRKVDEEHHHGESSGIGLALVRRTLDRIGGIVELQADPPRKRGTTFVVRWPKTIAI